MTENRVLITSLSVDPKLTKYKLMNKIVEAYQSPLALIQVLPQEKCPQQILVLCSKRIFNEQFDRFREEVQRSVHASPGKNIDEPPTVEALHVPNGVTTAELWQSLQVILESVPAGCRLTIDLTHGYRSLPFLILMAALYLRPLRNVQIEGVYYGMYEAQGDGNQSESLSVLLDMSVLLNMIEWFYAAKMFSDTGQAKYISDLLAPFGIPPADLKGPACSPYSKVKKLQELFQNMGAAYLQALPLEAGLESSALLNKLEEHVPEHLRGSIPLPNELFGKVKEFIEPFAMDNMKRNRDKRTLILDEEELKRQARMINCYIEQGYVNHSIGLMREWMVSAAMYQDYLRKGIDKVEGREWLVYHSENNSMSRAHFEFKYGRLQKLVQDQKHGTLLTQGQMWLGQQWGFLADKRNQLHHHGFKNDYSLLDSEKLDEIKQRWETIKVSLPEKDKWDLEVRRPGGILLISSLGHSKGLLYSALSHVQADEVFLLSSQDAVRLRDEIFARVNWQGSFNQYLMQDPHSGFNERHDVTQAIRSFLQGAERVVVNLTGGTTAMQTIIHHVASEARKLGCVVRMCALIDKRSAQEQQAVPYVLGEIVWLDED